MLLRVRRLRLKCVVIYLKIDIRVFFFDRRVHVNKNHHFYKFSIKMNHHSEIDNFFLKPSFRSKFSPQKVISLKRSNLQGFSLTPNRKKKLGRFELAFYIRYRKHILDIFIYMKPPKSCDQKKHS